MIVIQAPSHLLREDNNTLIFLAGSIEMGQAENWQKELIEVLNKPYNTILNPRRDDWDSTWVQSIDNDQFKKQVDWELNYLEKADLVIFYFAKNTKSPITLLELGLISGLNKKAIIYCDPDFWRRGNIEIISEKYNHLFFIDKKQFIDYLDLNL